MVKEFKYNFFVFETIKWWVLHLSLLTFGWYFLNAVFIKLFSTFPIQKQDFEQEMLGTQSLNAYVALL